MPEFLKLLPPKDALDQFLAEIKFSPAPEKIPVEEALGRILAEPVTAPYPLPSFPRSTVDGFAVRAADSHGASPSLPLYLNLVGEVPMGAAPQFEISKIECALIHTGGMLPEGADAVVMVEDTQQARDTEIEILKAVADGENVLQVGEDVQTGDEVIPAGKQLHPAEIGGLMALGITEVAVSRKPLVGIISSGDEVIPPHEAITPGQVRDVNSYTLSALIEQNGGSVMRYGIVADSLEHMTEIVTQAHKECDLVVITAGSSASARDLTAQVLDALGEPGVLVHGVNVRPGKPTILAVCDGVPMIGLPGNPVSALVIAGLFVVPVVSGLLGKTKREVKPAVTARLQINLSSQAGREDWVAVALKKTEDGYSAEPIFGKSNLIFTLAKADGLVRIPAPANGLEAGELVSVQLF
ncbi:MAG: gephyrin-like molybdotransferase Glp [Chloroflexota bacterium]